MENFGIMDKLESKCLVLKDFYTGKEHTRMNALEDDIINNGVKGGENAALKSVKYVNGNTKGAVNMTVKWDGAA